MKLPTVIRWGFDPDKSDTPALASKTGRKVWAAIKAQHIVSDRFDEQVLRFAEDFDRTRPSTPVQLFTVAKRWGLHVFGSSNRVMDAEFWGEMLLYLHGGLTIREVKYELGECITIASTPEGLSGQWFSEQIRLGSAARNQPWQAHTTAVDPLLKLGRDRVPVAGQGLAPQRGGLQPGQPEVEGKVRQSRLPAGGVGRWHEGDGTW